MDEEIDGGPPVCDLSANQSAQSAGGEMALRRDGAYVTEVAGTHASLQLDVLGPESQHQADHEQSSARLGRTQDRVRIFERQGNRLLQEDVPRA